MSNYYRLFMLILLATSYADAKKAKSSELSGAKKSGVSHSTGAKKSGCSHSDDTTKSGGSKSSNKNCKGHDSRCPPNETCATTANCVVSKYCFHRCFPCTCVHGDCLIDTSPPYKPWKHDDPSILSCVCHPGWTGANCDEDIVDCPDACQGPSSTCVDLPLGSFTCNCSDPGYELADNQTTCIDVVDCPDACQGPSSTCVDFPLGSFTCNCSDPGYELAVNETTCIDIDECLPTSPCSDPTSMCVNSEGSFSCTCELGWQEMAICVDRVDCPDACQGPSSTCVDLPLGSFTCSCSDPGYKLADNGTTCIDIDECLSTYPCTGPTAGCVNSEGSYTCTCAPGWQVNYDECVDVVDCPDACQGPSSTCVDLPPGSFTCSCSNPGYELGDNETTCIDINECLPTSPCTGPTAGCVNSEGSYTCTCAPGWQVNNDKCVDEVDCPDACQGPSSTCVDLPPGSFTCKCSDSGYELNDDETKCIDINECLPTSPCTGPTAGCVNFDGSYSCTCDSGWQVNGNECVDFVDCPNACQGPSSSCVDLPLGNFTCNCSDPGFELAETTCIDVTDCPDACQGPSSTCVDFPPGSFTCSCSYPGYELADNKTTCIDIDECSPMSPCTGPTAGCVNSEGSFSCTCDSGWQVNGNECVDVVDCPDACQGPSLTCVDLPLGSYTCSCSDPGYELADNKTTCIDIDECLPTSPCTGPMAGCVNSEGSYSCTCSPGWQANNDECVDEVDCPDACKGPSSICVDLPFGSFTCNCSDPGYKLGDDGTTCIDVVDCPDACRGPSSNCVDLPLGSFTCNCSDPGYMLADNETTCIDVNECLPTSPCTGPTADCLNSEGSYTCTCDSGWQINNDKCVDIDECVSTVPCKGPTAVCVNVEGSYSCKCGYGWQVNYDVCVDEVDCPGACLGPSSTCVDLPRGSFTCNCSDPGYMVADDERTCIDINECLPTSPCTGRTAYCVNSEGSYSCHCTSGWQVIEDECVDINECSSNPCSGQSASCTNTLGSYKCSCGSGYELKSLTRCEDKNECLSKPCTGPSASCTNTVGSYKCSCGSGFYLRYLTVCADINECISSPCTGPSAECFNLLGSFRCGCGTEFQLESPTKCRDIDECSSNPCKGPGANCTNTAGSFYCSCGTGYEMIATKTCGDIDECCTLSPCTGPTAGCVNSQGSYTCTCFSGWQVNNDECVDINECLSNTTCTGPTASCANTIGSFYCSCGTGYELLSQTICGDIDECPSACTGTNSICENTEGSFVCSCSSGYELIGCTHCQAIAV